MIRIESSVGAGSPNSAADVRALQEGLAEAARLMMRPQLGPGAIDGDAGVGTQGAISSLQRLMGYQRPDRRIDPGGRTLRRLNAWLEIGATDLLFPFPEPSEWAWRGPEAGMRAFDALRPRGRAHAGIDLYFPDATPIRAMCDGEVVQGPYPFYARTNAIEVDHGSFTARYGEIDPEFSPVRAGDRIQRGDVVGRVGVLIRSDGTRLNVPSMMLHLEMYDKTETGRLKRARSTSARSPHGIPYERRRDLIDPTGFVARASFE